MTSRLTQLEKVNMSLKLELKEKSIKMEHLENANNMLRDASDPDVAQKLK